MNVSIQLTQTTRSSNAGKCTTLRDVDLDMALTISVALNEQPGAGLESLIMIEGPGASHKLLASHTSTFPHWTPATWGVYAPKQPIEQAGGAVPAPCPATVHSSAVDMQQQPGGGVGGRGLEPIHRDGSEVALPVAAADEL